MKRIRTVIEKACDGTYSIYMDMELDDLDYFITATGKDIDDAKKDFFECYEEMREHYKEIGKHFEEVDFDFVLEETALQN